MGKVKYLEGLNGIRAIASIAVVVSHITLSLDYFGLNKFLFGTFDDGTARGLLLAGYGVNMFFVLSGFLITFLLLNEKQCKPISIKNFYIRRILRIWPLYFFYIIVVIISCKIFLVDFNYKNLSLYFLFVANIAPSLLMALPFLYHYWSLSIEEQYYILWPHLVKHFDLQKNLLKIIISLFFFIFSFKIFARVYEIKTGSSILMQIVQYLNFESMFIGSIGAILYFNKNELFLKISTNRYLQIVCWIILFLVAINKFRTFSIIDNTIISIVSICVIIAQITKQNRIINLENVLFSFLGKISFGIYIYHPIIIFIYSKYLNSLNNSVQNYLIIYFSIIFTTILIAYLSYNILEKPFLKMKNKYN
jgi:peptidoglycan/LPS O-acetylase OafA/YrhL